MNKSLNKTVLDKLNADPLFRERRYKNYGLVTLLTEMYPSLAQVPLSTLAKAMTDFNSMDRYWRMILAGNKELRGSDYKDRTYLKKNKQLELGYDVGKSFYEFDREARKIT